MVHPIQNPKMYIMTIVDSSDYFIKMDDGFSYIHPDFQGYPNGSQFAVLKEMDTGFCSGMIVQIIPIPPRFIAATAACG